jgi:antimicrobial peptide system SdpB family protein
MIKYLNRLSTRYSVENPWTPIYGIARSLLAFGTLLTLVFNHTNILFISLDRYANKESLFSNSIIDKANLFLLFGEGGVWISKLIGIVILLAVIIGWRPRITGILHFWVSISFSTLSGTIDGGDTITSIVTFFLIPVCLSDNRISHWDASEKRTSSDSYVRLFVWSIFFVLRIQGCIIYLHAGIDKLRIEEWVNGTCTYYWFTNATYGAADWLKPFVMSAMKIPLVVVLFTWGTLIFEILLGMMIMRRRNSFNWQLIFWSAIVFHLGIVLIFGLISFFFAMSAVLVLYMVPLHTPFRKLVPSFIQMSTLRRYLPKSKNNFEQGISTAIE